MQEAGPTQGLKHVEYPSDDEWAAAVAAHQTRVFVCWVAEGRGRISFSWDAVAKGVTDNLSVKVLSSEDSLFMNFARAEEYLTTSSCRTVESFTGCPRITTKHLQPETTGTPGVPFNF